MNDDSSITEQSQPCRIVWQKRLDGSAKLLRMYGTSSQVFVPPQIQGVPCTEIAPYCFAETAHLPDTEIEETLQHTVMPANGNGEISEKDIISSSCLQELCGSAIQEVHLPDTVQKIGNCAFYNCKKLKNLHLGAAAEEIGSDAFMNTLSFHRIYLYASADKKSGIRKILSQISSDMEVLFETDMGIEAALLYPEYYESYDEIAPAHLFGRSITGEGFRARQCFREGIVDFAGYDAIFAQACVEESEKTLSGMAWNRLRYPYALSNKHKETYKEYLKAHMEGTMQRMIRQKDLPALLFLCQEGLLKDQTLAASIRMAAAEDWAEGAASLLQCQAHVLQKKKQSRYLFEDFE